MTLPPGYRIEDYSTHYELHAEEDGAFRGVFYDEASATATAWRLYRDPHDVISALKAAHAKSPDMRVGQLILNAVRITRVADLLGLASIDDSAVRLQNIENPDLAAALRAFAGGSDHG